MLILRLLNRVRTKITLLLLIFAALPAVGGFISVLKNESEFRAMGQQRAQDAAVQAIETVDRELLQRYGDVQAFALNRATQVKAYYSSPDYPNPLTDAMNAYMRVYGVYGLMALVAADGTVLAVPTVDGAGKPMDTRWLYDASFAGAPWLARALKEDFLVGRNNLTGTVVEPPAAIPQVAKLTGGDGLSIAFAAPVRDKDGKPFAVWVNFARFDVIRQVLAAARGHMVSAGIPGAGIRLADASGAALHQDLGTAAGPVAEGRAPSGGAGDFPGLGWSVAMALPEHELYATIDRIEREMLITGLVTAVLTLAAGLWVGTLAARPINGLTGTMDRLSHGDLDVAIPSTGRADEIGEMARAVGVFRENALAVRRLEADQKERERLAEEEKKLLMRRLADTFEASVREVVQRVTTSSASMEKTAEDMAATAEQTTKLSTAVASAADTAKSNVDSAAAAAEELARSVEEIARQVTESARIAQRAVDGAEQSKLRVLALTGAAHKIGEILGLIDRIAAQTNMLALNATIEAASAGDSGRGFAVVAAEVKDLSRQIGSATSQISEIVATVRTATDDAAQAMQSVGGTITEISNIAAVIAAAVEQQEAATREIARSSQHAASSTRDVSTHIATVSKVAGQTGSAAGQVLVASHGMWDQSNTLRQEVERFLAQVRCG